MMVWQDQERNEWDVAIHRSLEGFGDPVAVAPEGPNLFSLANPTTEAHGPMFSARRRLHVTGEETSPPAVTEEELYGQP